MAKRKLREILHGHQEWRAVSSWCRPPGPALASLAVLILVLPPVVLHPKLSHNMLAHHRLRSREGRGAAEAAG